ncbi:MAG: DUF2946 family protein [Burkholderiaceae bacterium]
MDDLVRQALAKWPDVPDCTGWLALDARGRWRIGDANDGPRLPITNAGMIAFINRNYQSAGRSWFFQNGPQRVFVELEYTPFVWRLHPGASGGADLITHTGVRLAPSSVWLDDEGRFLVEALAPTGETIVGVIHDHDTALVAELLRDDDGDPLDDDAISQLVSNGVRETATKTGHVAHVQWIAADATSVLLPLQRIASHQVAGRFGFEPRPSTALPVDPNTQR